MKKGERARNNGSTWVESMGKGSEKLSVLCVEGEVWMKDRGGKRGGGIERNEDTKDLPVVEGRRGREGRAVN